MGLINFVDFMVVVTQIILFDRPVMPFLQQLSWFQVVPWESIAVGHIGVGEALHWVCCKHSHVEVNVPEKEKLLHYHFLSTMSTMFLVYFQPQPPLSKIMDIQILPISLL